MLDTHALSDDELLETMTSLQGEMDRRYRVETLQEDISRLTGELEAAQAELARLLPDESQAEPEAGGPSAPLLDLSQAVPWTVGDSYGPGALVSYLGRYYQALLETSYSPAAYPQAWQEVAG